MPVQHCTNLKGSAKDVGTRPMGATEPGPSTAIDPPNGSEILIEGSISIETWKGTSLAVYRNGGTAHARRVLLSSVASELRLTPNLSKWQVNAGCFEVPPLSVKLKLRPEPLTSMLPPVTKL
jgi:hypothetical protein